MSANNLGHVTAYAYAKSKGYTGTEAQFAQLMADFAGAANTAVEAAEEAEGYKNAAAGSASTANAAAGNAMSYRDSAGTSAHAAEDAAAAVLLYKGSPMVAATAAEMTDTDHVYVYTGSEVGYTAGNWYYYDGNSWESGGVYNAVVVQTDSTLSEAGEAADAKATGAAIAQEFKANVSYPVGEYVLYSGTLYRFTEDHGAGAWTGTDVLAVNLAAEVTDIKEKTTNLWLWGDKTATEDTRPQVLNVNLPAGTYTLSADLVSTGTGNARMMFYKNSIAIANQLANPYLAVNAGRNSVTFTLAEKADIILVLAGPNESSENTTTWNDIQIESGAIATNYVPPVTATDYVARGKSTPFDNFSELIGVHTQSKTIRIQHSPLSHNPLLFVIDAKYEMTGGSTAYPYIQFSVRTDRGFDRTSAYFKIGDKGRYRVCTLRSVPYIWDNRNATLNLVIPAGCTLTVKNAYWYPEADHTQTIGGIQFHAHDGSCLICPRQSLSAVRMAIAASYNSFIVIPKVSSDGVWFAYHDDTFDISTTYLKNSDGTTITDATYDGDYFSDIPWSYLSQLLAGTSYGAQFADEHLMRLDDYFMLCAKTGISPMFSMHPRVGVQTTSALQSLKALLNKYGLLDKLIMKMPLVLDDGVYTLSNFTTIFSVFGNDIARYEVDAASGMPNPASVITLLNGVSHDVTVPMTVEFWVDQLYTDPTLVAAALSAGYAVSAASANHTDPGNNSVSHFTSEDVRYLSGLGVTEYTDEYFTSNGLDW